VADYTKVTGVAAADIVKIDGVAIANVEKVDGATKPSVGAIDWTESLWYEDNLTSTLGDWSDGDSQRKIGFDGDNEANMDNTVIPFLDDSDPSDLQLKFVFAPFMAGGSRAQFLECDTGTRVQLNSGNHPDTCGMTDTGVTFDGSGNLVDAQHVIQVGYKNIPSGKGSTLYRRSTVVIDVASNVMRAHRRATNNTGSGVAYPTVAFTVSTPQSVDWSFTYDPDTNTWTNTGTASYVGLWHRVAPASGMSTGPDDSGNGCEKKYTTYYVDADTDEHRIWYFKSG
jgi:hypothetical protein